MTSMKPVGIVAAFRRETAGLLKRLDGRRWEKHDGLSFFLGGLEGKKIIVATSGMGQERAARASAALLDRFQPCCLLAIGFAGALIPELRPGNLILGAKILSPPPSSMDFHPSPLLLDLAEKVAGSAGLPYRRGTLLSLNRVLVEPGEKKEAAHIGALAVDVESGTVAQMASKGGLPFLTVRAISDAFDQALGLDFNRLLTRNGDLSFPKALLALFARPGALPALWRLKHTSDRALRSLSGFLAHFLSRLEPTHLPSPSL